MFIGLDTSNNLTDEDGNEVEEEEPTLNEPFPWTRVPFSVTFAGVQPTPPRVDELTLDQV